MKEIFDIFRKLELTSSRNDKEFILNENKDNQLLKKTLEYTYNPYKIYGIGKKSFKTESGMPALYHDLFDLLDYLNANNSSDATKFQANAFISNQPVEDREWCKRIILKDLKIGVTETTINKIWKNCVPVCEVMLAEKYWDHKDKIKGKNFILTMKLNGHRGIIIKDNGTVKMFTRQGQSYLDLVEIEADVAKLPDGYVYDGEFTIANYQDIHSKEVYKETSKAIRPDGVKTGLVFRMFDMISVGEFYRGVGLDPCWLRKSDITNLLQSLNLKHIEEVPVLYVGNDQSVIEPMVKEVADKGEEGLMLNLSDSVYECKRSRGLLKIKLFKDADLLVTNVIEGDGRNKGKLGAITVQFEHEGKLWECECGSGFSDAERVKYFTNPELLIGKIVQIKYFEITSNAKGGFGLQFPVWIGIIRTDKTEISMF